MKIRLIILLISISTCLFSQVKIDIPELYGDNFIESELIQQVTIVPLKFDKSGMVTERMDLEMKCDAENYFILDNKNTQCVYRFNQNGEFENSICDNKPGIAADGPVLNNPVKVSLNWYKKQVEIYNFESSRITRYDYNGKMMGKTPMEINPSDFIRDENGIYWIYTGWNNKLTQYRLLKIDQNGKKLDQKMRLISKCMPTENFSFNQSKKGICFWELLGNSTYLISGDEIKETYRFDYGVRNLSQNYHLLDPFDGFKEMNEKGYFAIKKYLENDDVSYFFLNFTNMSMNQKEMFHVIYDKKGQQAYIYTENSGIGAFDKAQDLTSENELVFLVSPRKLRQLLRSDTEFIPATFVDLDEQIGDLKDPVILKIKLNFASREGEN